MTAPIAGPFVESEYLNKVNPGGFTYRAFERDRSWYTQKPPYDQPLSYWLVERRITTLEEAKMVGCAPTQPWTWYVGTERIPQGFDPDANCYNTAYDRLKSKIGASAQIGLATAEGRQAMGMMTNRLLQMAKFTRAMARGRWGDAKDILEWKQTQRQRRWANKQGAREGARGFANKYLEFHFGWSPLVADIYDAAEVLSSEIKPQTIRGSAKVRRVLQTGIGVGVYDGTYDSWQREDVESYMEQRIELRAEVSVQNPNLALASQMGLINPLTIAWELVPFSFVLDWFLNVGDFLDSFTDFAGLNLINSQRTEFTRYFVTSHLYRIKNVSAPVQTSPVCSDGHRQQWRNTFKGEGVYMKRIVGPFPGPTLKLRDFKGLSPRRGLAAASLLMQAFPTKVLEESAASVARKRSSFRRQMLPEQYWNH